MRWRQRVGVAVNLLGWGSFALVAVVLVALLLASAHAPPPAEPRPLDYDDDPGEVAADAVYNLRAAEYTYEVRVRDTGDLRRPADSIGTGFRIFGKGPATTMVHQVRIDNRARRYRARITLPFLVEGKLKWIRYYAEGPRGHIHVPRSIGGPASAGGDLGYTPRMNAFDRRALAGANATVVTNNRTTYVVRVTDDDAAMEAAYPGTPTPLGTTSPGTQHARANLTLTIDKSTGHVTAAVLRYHNHETGRHIVTTFTFGDYGETVVARPLYAEVPGPVILAYRLDLGLWALATMDWLRVGRVLAALAVGGLLVERTLGGKPW